MNAQLVRKHFWGMLCGKVRSNRRMDRRLPARPGGFKFRIEQQGPHTDSGAVFRRHQQIVFADRTQSGQYARVFKKYTAPLQMVRKGMRGEAVFLPYPFIYIIEDNLKGPTARALPVIILLYQLVHFRSNLSMGQSNNKGRFCIGGPVDDPRFDTFLKIP